MRLKDKAAIITGAASGIGKEIAIVFARELPQDARLLLTIRPGDLLDDEPDATFQQTLAGILRHFDTAAIEHWDASTWEAFSLQVLWTFCRDGLGGRHDGGGFG